MLDVIIDSTFDAKKNKCGHRHYCEQGEGERTIMDWMPRYERGNLRMDLVAGLTAGIVFIPAAIGWASVAGVPAVYGLYAAMFSLIAYFIFCTSGHLLEVTSSGPAALVGAGLAGMVFADQNECISAVAMLAFFSIYRRCAK